MNLNNIKYAVYYVTVSSRDMAEKISSSLVKNKLAACVNITDNVNSIYFWDNKVNNDKELLLIIKSKINLKDTIEKEIKNHHDYDTFELIGLPIITGSKKYLEFIESNTL